jgi:hypothetical protein
VERQIDPICATVMPPGADLETVRNGGSASVTTDLSITQRALLANSTSVMGRSWVRPFGQAAPLADDRGALPDTRLAQINAAAATGDDPELATLILRLHTETACRPCDPGTLTRSSAWSCCGRRARRSAGSPSPNADGPPHRARLGAARPGGRAVAVVRRRMAGHLPPA